MLVPETQCCSEVHTRLHAGPVAQRWAGALQQNYRSCELDRTQMGQSIRKRPVPRMTNSKRVSLLRIQPAAAGQRLALPLAGSLRVRAERPGGLHLGAVAAHSSYVAHPRQKPAESNRAVRHASTAAFSFLLTVGLTKMLFSKSAEVLIGSLPAAGRAA